MANPFGLSKFPIFQDIISFVTASVPNVLIHNWGKYFAIKKAHYLCALEGMEGDYLEFGVFTGSSFTHSIRCYKKNEYFNGSKRNMSFWGFDSFEGFGTITEDEKHPFYTDLNFDCSFESVQKRVHQVAGKTPATLVKGFFHETCAIPSDQYGIQKIAILFIDCDLYHAANDAFFFSESKLQDGTIVIMDDFYSYKGSLDKGISKSFFDFIKQSSFSARFLSSYGMGGVVYVLSKNNEK